VNSYTKKIAEIDFLHDLGLRRSELKRVTANFQRKRVSYKTEGEWVAAIESALSTIRQNPMEDEIKKEAIAVSQLCPVCRQQAEPISLMKGRKAYYCSTHRAVTPAIVNEDDVFNG
jgi:hypothetical protein